MQKHILITGATDGIGFETAKVLAQKGHHLIIHGRSSSKIEHVINQLKTISNHGNLDSVIADFSDLSQVKQMATEMRQRFDKLDVLINNAGVYKVPDTITKQGLETRFAVNTYAPYLLTKTLLPMMDSDGRVVNLSSAAQSSVNLDALAGEKNLGDGDAYAQSKLALTMWSRVLGLAHKDAGPMIVSVNPKSLLGSKMVKSAYGIAGSDLSIGADILVRASLSDEFASAHGKYFDNDIEAFSSPHPEALNETKAQQVVNAIEVILDKLAL